MHILFIKVNKLVKNVNKDEHLKILTDWNFWKTSLRTGNERKQYSEKCLRFLKSNVVVSIIGVRRSGKSYIMRQAIKKLIDGGIDRKNTLMINFEDQRFAEFYPKLLDEIYETYLEALKPEGKPFVFLDEVHNVPQWERWVRTMHELEKAKIILSGSSSKLLTGDLATVLTGRHLDIHVFPLSFKEFLYFRGLEINDELSVVSKRIEIKRFFSEYFEFGGFPEVVLSGDKKQLLLAYFDDMLTKDIEKRYLLKKSEKLRALARFYLTNFSNTITFNSLKKTLDTTVNTIEKYSSYLEEACMIFFVKRFSFKVKEQENSARKVYSVDSGLANAIGFKFSENMDRIAENIVAVELKRKQAENPNLELYYWKSVYDEEVDFVVKESTTIKQLIQVCWDISEYRVKNREIKALIKGARELSCNNLLVITGDYEGKEKIASKGENYDVLYVPLWKWLLAK